MRSRREQVQAYRFLIRRIVSALLVAEPETTELPMRRFGAAVFGSVVVAIALFAGFGIYGLLHPGGQRPVQNAIIVERETGAKYLYLQGYLHPILNWTSALLILNAPQPAVRTMSRGSLRDVPRGAPVGIADAPDTLPVSSALVGPPWTVCSAPRAPTSVTLATQVFVGHEPAGGVALGAGQGLLVSVGAPSGPRFLLTGGHRLRVRDNGVLAALGWAGVTPVAVGEAFLNAIPPGPDLAPLVLPGAGTPTGLQVGGAIARVGQLFRSADQQYIMVDKGLAPVGEVTGLLLQATGVPVTAVSAPDVGRLLVNTAVEPPGFPARRPELRAADSQAAMACAVYRGGGGGDDPVNVETFREVTGDVTGSGTAAAGGPGADGVTTADRVVLEGGHGALVSTATPAGATAPGTVYLVLDQGLKYPLPQKDTDKVRAALGYQGVPPVPVPASILALVPTGVALDPDAAVLLAPPRVVPSRSS
jgi:type VII secretion protein EccB